MRCDDIRELISAHVDGCLNPDGAQRLADHLGACASCREDLAALERTVKQLHELPTVQPPADLTDRIHARLRRAHRPGVLRFLSLPQTRVALAASLVIVLTALGIRQRYATRAVCEVASPPAGKLKGEAVARDADAPMPMAAATVAAMAEAGVQANAPAGQQAEQVRDIQLREAQPAAPRSEEQHGALRMRKAAQPASRMDEYTFRTERLTEASAIVSRHAGRVENSDRALETPSRAVVLDVTIPPADWPALMDELRQIGAVLVEAPARGNELAKVAAPRSLPRAMPDVAGGGLAAPSAAPGGLHIPTNRVVRVTLLPPEP